MKLITSTNKDTMSEVWKDITGYEGYYQVSDKGRVRSIARSITRSDGVVLNYKGKVVNPYVNNQGYSMVRLYRRVKTFHSSVHTLVAQAFLEYIKNGKTDIVVDHIDEDKLNNNLSNLQLLTNNENVQKHYRALKGRKYTGVSKYKRRWKANLTIDTDMVYLGLFETEDLADDMVQLAMKYRHVYNGDPKAFRKYVEETRDIKFIRSVNPLNPPLSVEWVKGDIWTSNQDSKFRIAFIYGDPIYGSIVHWYHDTQAERDTEYVRIINELKE